MRKIIKMPKELILSDGSQWGVSSSNNVWHRVDNKGYILDTKRMDEVPKSWNTWLSQRCGCMEIHENKVKCAGCGKKAYSMGHYPSDGNHYCHSCIMTTVLPNHNLMMKEKYGVLSTEEFNKKISKDLDEINENLRRNPLVRIYGFITGR